MAAAWIVLAAPVSEATASTTHRWVALVPLGLGALGVGWRTAPTSWLLRLTTAVAAGAAVAPLLGERLGLWLTCGVVLANWVCFDRPPLPGVPAAAIGSIPPVVVLCGVSALVAHQPVASLRPLVPFALAMAVPLLGRLGDGLLHRVATRVGLVAGTAVQHALFWVLGVMTVVAPWVTRRLVGAAAPPSRVGWLPRERRPLQATQPWAREAHRPVPVRSRRRTAIVVLLVVGVGAFAVNALRPTTSPLALRSLVTDSEEQSEAAWHDELQADLRWVLDADVAFRPFEVYRLLDVETRHVNVRGGDRVSWTPPDCDCRRATVWIYGGSAAFGMNQRDSHTIASALARAAAADGVALDVVNRGVPGQAHWRSSLRFAWDLTHEPAPDLAIFYDGAEEIDAAVALTAKGRGDVAAPYEAYVEQVYDQVYGDEPRYGVPDSVEELGWPTIPGPVATSAGELAVRRYERSRKLSATTARANAVDTLYVWHPARTSAPGGAPDDRAEAFATAAALLSDDVVDLVELPGEELDDGVNPDESGTSAAADALYAHVRDVLDVRDPTDAASRP